MKKLFLILIIASIGITAFAQTENEPSDMQQITETLLNYIEGTANGEPDRLWEAFHPDFNLYSVNKHDSLYVWEGKDYVSGVREGQKSNRIGRIISIDYENNAAVAKAEILIPDFRTYTDYFMLLKIQGAWKIIHKSYTWRPIQYKSDKK